MEASPLHNSISKRHQDWEELASELGPGDLRITPLTSQGDPSRFPASRRGWEGRGMLRAHRGQAGGVVGGQDSRPPPHSPRQSPLPLQFVWVEMKMNCYRTAGQERAVNSLGLLTHMCRLFLSERDHCLGDRGPEKALVMQGRCRQDTRTAAPDACSLWARPHARNTDRGSGMALAAGRAWGCSLQGPQAGHLSGPGKRAWV